MRDSRIWSLMFSGRLHPEGRLFVRWGALGVLILFVLGYYGLGKIAALATLGVGLFFRDPTRVTPLTPNVLVSPADGLVIGLDPEVSLPADLFPEVTETGAVWTRVSIFLSLLDVHVNRIPVSGRVESVVSKKGTFYSAMSSKAGEQNERTGILISTPTGQEVGCVQLAGYLARRIVCSVQEEDSVLVGQDYGIICFGSRVDLYVPEGVSVLVQEGMRMVGGETVIGILG